MIKKLIPLMIAAAVSAMFILPGIASGEGRGTPNPPPSNPPCDSDGHDGLAPPYGGPNQNSGSCDHGTGNATGQSTGGQTGNATGNACPPTSHNPGGDPNCGHGTTTSGSSSTTTSGTSTTTSGTSTTTSGTSTTTSGTTTTTTTGAALNQCDWNVVLGGMTVIPDSFIEGAIGVHVDLPPDPATHTTGSLVHACLGIGSIVTPDGGGQCPTGTTPIEAQTDQASFLLLCALL